MEIVKKVIPSGLFVPLKFVEGYDGRSGTIWIAAEWPARQAAGAARRTSARRAHPDYVRRAGPGRGRRPDRFARRPRRAPATAGRDVNLALKDISHNLGRFLLTCLGLSLLLGIVLAMVGIYRGLIVESLGLVRAAGAQVWVVEGDTRGPFAEASRLPGRYARGHRRAMGRRRGRRRLLSECRSAASRPDQAAAGRRRADRAAGRGAVGGRRPADPAQPLRGGRGPRRRARCSASRSSSGAIRLPWSD